MKTPAALRNKLYPIILLVAGSFLVFQASGAALSIVRGKAWWGPQNDYVYFNCLDDVIGDNLDTEFNLCGGDGEVPPEECGPPDNVFQLFAEPCSWLVHGVYIDEQGNFSGSAYNYAKGLISFEATTTPDAADPPDNYAFNVNCPNVCNEGNGCWACYNDVDQQVYGWGRSTVDGTWLRLDSSATPPVQIKSWHVSSSTDPYYAIQAGDFVGTATSGIGDLSFNCLSEIGGADNCATRDYEVYISNLQVGQMSAPNWSYGDACSQGALKAVLKWNLKSGRGLIPKAPIDQQTKYEIIISQTNSTSTPTCLIGPVNSAAGQHPIDSSSCAPGFITYDQDYYWWLRLYDQNDQPTEWYQFGVVDGHNGAAVDNVGSGGVLTAGDGALAFRTYKHEFPSPFITWEPEDLDEQVGTTTDFMSYSMATTSNFYTAVSPTTPQACTSPACAYLWTVIDNPDSTISSTTAPVTEIVFAHATKTTVTLQITDADNYTCTKIENELYVNYGLPIWREVKAN